MILLDTHVLIWVAADSPTLGKSATRLASEALQGDGLAVSAVSCWEIFMLVEKGRLETDLAPAEIRLCTLRLGIIEIPLDGEIAIAAARLQRFPGDPADRRIVATALGIGAVLLTADKSILRWKGPLKTRDARM